MPFIHLGQITTYTGNMKKSKQWMRLIIVEQFPMHVHFYLYEVGQPVRSCSGQSGSLDRYYSQMNSTHYMSMNMWMPPFQLTGLDIPVKTLCSTQCHSREFSQLCCSSLKRVLFWTKLLCPKQRTSMLQDPSEIILTELGQVKHHIEFDIGGIALKRDT